MVSATTSTALPRGAARKRGFPSSPLRGSLPNTEAARLAGDRPVRRLLRLSARPRYQPRVQRAAAVHGEDGSVEYVRADSVDLSGDTSASSTVDSVRRIVDIQLNYSAHGYELGHDDDLWAWGMTSLACVGLMLTVEETFDVELPDDLLDRSTFASVRAIATAVDSVLPPRGEARR